jgi:hypothetical protein
MTGLKTAARLVSLVMLVAAHPVEYSDYAGQFDRFEARTRTVPPDARVAMFRELFRNLRPGLYTSSDPQRLNHRILRSLQEFPQLQPAYRSVVQRFGPALSKSVAQFRTVFPDFSPPLPIILAHELGVRDGGTDFIAGKKVMLFGADKIARLHNDDSLQPFLDHELFHLEHARHFADCDPFWCLLWQEGLATYAASVMTPGADDHQLLLDQPQPIRGATDQNWKKALCLAAAEFDRSDQAAITSAFSGGEPESPSDLPRRFGYYVGLRVAREAAGHSTLPELAALDDEHARPVVASALGALISNAGAPCGRPSQEAPITRTVDGAPD